MSKATTTARGYGTAADLAPLVSATIGRHIDRKQVTYFGRSGRITQHTNPDGTTHYLITHAALDGRDLPDMPLENPHGLLDEHDLEP